MRLGASFRILSANICMWFNFSSSSNIIVDICSVGSSLDYLLIRDGSTLKCHTKMQWYLQKENLYSMISKALSKQKVIAGQRGLRMKSNIIQYKITWIIQSVSCKHHQNVNKESRTLFLFFAHTGLIIHSSKLCAISLAWVKLFFRQKWYTHDVHVVIQDGAEKVDERQKTQTP